MSTEIDSINIAPYDIGGTAKNPNIISTNYTNQDFWSMKTRLIQFINERFGPTGTVLPNTFNDLVESSIAIMLIENWSFLADTLSFKMDQIVNELFIDTVTEIDNAFRLSKLVGFNPQPPIAARSKWIAVINSVLTTDLTIPTPVSVRVSSGNTPINIELFPSDSDGNPILDQDIVIQAGATSNQAIIGLEGTTATDRRTGTGNIAQNFQLKFTSVIYDSIRVQVDGIMWRQVGYFTDSQPRREYRVEFDSNYNAFVIFGNNVAGLIPGAGSIIDITYRYGGGIAGNIVTGSVTTQIQAVVPGFSFSVPVSLNNYTAGEYGYDGDTIDDVRRKLPLWIRTQNRAVSGEDYKITADQFATPYHGQVGKSTAVLRNYGCAANVIDIYILALNGTNGLAEPSNELKVELSEYINTVKMLTDYACIRNGTIISVDASIDITLDKFYKKFELELRQNITNKINSFFSLNNWDYGQTLKNIDIIKDLSDIKEVKTYDITFVTNDINNSGPVITADFNEIIRPDDITLSFIYV